MTAIFGATYPGGIVVASDSFRISNAIDGTRREIKDAQKIICAGGMLVASAGCTIIQSLDLGEVLNVSKVIAATIGTRHLRGEKFQPSDVEVLLKQCVQLIGQCHGKAFAEVLIGFPQVPAFIVAESDGENSELKSNTHFMGIGEAKAYWLHFNNPSILPEILLTRIKSAAPPPMKEHPCSSKAEATEWTKAVLEWVCKIAPESCGGEIQQRHLERLP